MATSELTAEQIAQATKAGVSPTDVQSRISTTGENYDTAIGTLVASKPSTVIGTNPYDPSAEEYAGWESRFGSASVLPSAGTSPYQDTSIFRSEETEAKKGAADIIAYADYGPSSNNPANIGAAATSPYSGEKSAYDSAYKAYGDVAAGRYTTEQQAQIDAAVEQARLAGEAQIAQAQAQKTQGMGKNLVEAGQRGGLMNTQYAGLAALIPTNAGNFIGAGGELERVQSAYDLNIQQAITTRDQAMAQARLAAQEAVRTGSVDAYKIAKDAYDTARAANKEVQDLEFQKKQFALDVNRDRREQDEFEFKIGQELDKPSRDANAEVQKKINELWEKYPDAGIDPFNDSANVAAQKVANSASFKLEQEQKGDAQIQRYKLAKAEGFDGTLLDFIHSEEQSSTTKSFKEIGGKLYEVGDDGVLRPAQFEGVEEQNDAVTEALQGKIDLIDNLMTSRGLGGSVGSYWFSRWTPLSADKADRQDFAAGVLQLVSTDTLDTLLALKAKGGTLGALSDSEARILREAAGKIGTWTQVDKEGKPTGKFEVSEKLFKTELEKIRNVTETALGRAYGVDVDDFRKVRKDPEFKDKSDKEIWDALGKSEVDADTNQGVTGSLSEKYESGGNPGAIGYDSTGGYSYGAYQLAHNNAKTFVDSSKYAGEFSGIPFNSKAWQAKWKEVATKDPQGFKDAQKSYISKTHYMPQAALLAKNGVDVNKYSPTLRDVIWSTAVQHGPNTKIIADVMREIGRSASESEIIKKIYEKRWGNGAGFASSTPAVKKAVHNRFFGPNGELATALASLNKA